MNLLVALILAATPAPSDTLVVPLQEVVVTGTRTPESVLKAPAAITVVNRNLFIDSRGLSLKDALSFVPGVFVQSRAGAQDVRVTIRGFGARGNGERSNTGNMRGIRVMTDGIPVTEPDGRSSLDLVDLGTADKIEVSRSNSSTLYGNASGGVVNLRTNLSFESPYLELRSRAGSFGFHREQGTVGMAIGAGRGTFSLLNSTIEGWREHSGSAATQAQGRFTVPIDDRTRLGLLLDAASTLNRFPGPLTQAQVDADPRQANPTFVSRDERRWNRVGRFGVTVDHSIEESQNLSVNLFAEPKVLQRSERNRFRDFNRYHLGGGATYQLHSKLSQGVTSVTTIGGDEAFQDGSILFYNLGPGGTRSSTIFANKREAANSAGGFLQQELKFGEHWSVRGAARYDNVWYVSEDHIDPTLDAEKTFTRWTPKGSVAYLFEHHTIYAALGGGVETPAFNEIDPPPDLGLDTLTSLNPFLDAMHSTTYEFGVKGQLIEAGSMGTLGYDAALYWIDVENEIVPFNGGAYFFTAGKSRRKGAELGLDWHPISALGLRGALTVSDNQYVEYVNDLGDFGGKETPGLPRSTVIAEAEYKTPVGLGAALRVENVGRYFADDANTAATKAYTLLGGSLAYELGVGGGSVLRAYLAGDNLTDQDHIASVFINGISGQYFEPGLPRSIHGGLTLRWQ